MTDNTHRDSGITTSSEVLAYYAETALMYEELRAAIDGGHESMTHADALAEIAAIRAENAALQQVYDTTQLEIDHLRGATKMVEPAGEYPPLPTPDSYLFQHEETGVTQYVDSQQVEWGFEKNNPRLQRIGGAFTEAQMRAYVDTDRAMRAQADSQPAPTYKDSTPELHVGDSAFESWYSTYNPAHKSDKQRARDAYAAGMGDPLVMAAPAAVAGQCEDAIELLGKYKDLCEEIKRGDSYHIGRIDAAISVLAQAAPVAQGDAEDAARWRWLRENWFTMTSRYDQQRIRFKVGEPRWSDIAETELDAAIDAARKQGGAA